MSININSHLGNRKWMASALVREIFGPGGRYEGWTDNLYSATSKIERPDGKVFDNWDEYNQRCVDSKSGQELLKDEPPSKRYGVGILFPEESEESLDSEKAPTDADAAVEGATGMVETVTAEDELSKEERKLGLNLARQQERLGALKEQEEDLMPGDDSELDGLKLARLRRPRSMGITFVADCGHNESIQITIEGGRYLPVDGIKAKNKDGTVSNFEHRWWVRFPVAAVIPISLQSLMAAQAIQPIQVPAGDIHVEGLADLDLRLEIRCRVLPDAVSNGLPTTARLVTATLVNRSKAKLRAGVDCLALFQSRFFVAPEKSSPQILLPLPRTKRGSDEEEQSVDLLYREFYAFASGHGCAGDWIADEGSPFAGRVIAEPIPFHETAPVTPDLIRPDTQERIEFPMLPLANAADGWMAPLEELGRLYEAWIVRKRGDMLALGDRHQAAATKHLNAAADCHERIKAGLRLLAENPLAAQAFQLANEAVLLQQLAGKSGLRRINYDPTTKRIVWDKSAVMPSLAHPEAPKRAWRPFQIAFLLMSLKGLWDGKSPDRLIADLIWFPTGGGKTEAYLGTTAFLLFTRRLQNKEGDGTGVLMRYTLRLLTSQQFQRAAGLICAMEIIRVRLQEQLGKSPFRIGIWVGGGTTPNTQAGSVNAFNDAKKDGPDKYSHVLLRCPWCGSMMGPRRRHPAEPGNSRYSMEGLETDGAGASRRVRIHCPDRQCSFNGGLPVVVVDQEIYEHAPSLVIGTVDKFAMLAWKPQARAIFGIRMDGSRFVSPPGLIIQDELHLITGPLGSMVGLYEGVIEELCTDRRNGASIRPKLIASTATTRASTRQIGDLYAREKTAIFPPPGLDAGDSFFATYDRDEKGKIKPGRMYLGVLARAYGSGLTVNVRVFAALLAAAARVPEKERDPWWTLLVFYNSLRELGSGLTLFGADIPERLRDLQKRWHPGEKRRFLNEVLELTGRLSNSDVPRALESLEKALGSKGAVDACLASNIIEVGVDVPRLALMAVSGQPKNTAQYIQATGRIGRELPGLVVMGYDNRKPRDLSHFEHFRDYHARLYAAVEPASVTPFTIQVMERALHGAFIAWSRQQLPEADQASPRQFSDDQAALANSFVKFAENYRDRLRFLLRNDQAALAQAETRFKDILKRRRRDWLSSSPSVWENQDMTGHSAEMPLMRRFGEPCKAAWEVHVWPTPTSMRGVDAECPAVVCTESVDVLVLGADVLNAVNPLDQLFN
jgi:Helicase conserved C-terminal domain